MKRALRAAGTILLLLPFSGAISLVACSASGSKADDAAADGGNIFGSDAGTKTHKAPFHPKGPTTRATEDGDPFGGEPHTNPDDPEGSPLDGPPSTPVRPTKRRDAGTDATTPSDGDPSPSPTGDPTMTMPSSPSTSSPTPGSGGTRPGTGSMSTPDAGARPAPGASGCGQGDCAPDGAGGCGCSGTASDGTSVSITCDGTSCACGTGNNSSSDSFPLASACDNDTNMQTAFALCCSN
jgi:hypothetical protein